MLIAYAHEAPDKEICGLLFGDASKITHIQKTDNISNRIEDQFEIDPAQLIAAHRAARVDGPAVLGCFHSHPNGVCLPSMQDAKAATPDGSLWVIIAGGAVGAWRAIHNGELFGRFSPVRLHCVD